MNNMKRYIGDKVKIKAIGGSPYVEGYLVRFSDVATPDLTGEYFNKSTYFMMDAGYPIKGAPTMYEHGLTGFGSIGIGVLDFVDEDDVGIFVRGKLYERQDYEKMLESIGKRKNLNLSPAQIKEKARLAEQAVFKVLNEVEHGWSMAANPTTVKISEDGHIEQCGIIEGSLTVIPAEPNGTAARMYQKSIINAFDFNEIASETSESGSIQKTLAQKPTTKQLGETNMDVLTTVREALAALLAQIDQAAMEQGMEEKQVDPEELKEEALTAAEELLEEDKEAMKQMDEEMADEEKKPEEAAKSARQLVDNWLEDNIEEIMTRAVTRIDQKRAKVNSAFKNALGGNGKQSKRKSAGAYSETMHVPPQVNKTQKPGLAAFIKSCATHNFSDFYGKAQNPYIGDHGGYLLGQELRNEILPPLRADVVAFKAGVRQTNVAAGVGTITLPKMTTAPTAYRPGINTAVSDSDASFDTVTAFLRPIAAKTTIPFQLLEQSPLAVEQRIRDEMIRSISLLIDLEILNGTGAVTGSNTGAEIRGVKTALQGDSTLSSSNVVALATNGRKPTYADATAAETQIAAGNVPDSEPKAWIMHSRSRGRYRDLTATTGEPLFRENYGNEAYPELIGYPVHVGNQISITDTTGTSTDTSEIYFGAWRFIEYVMQDNLEVIVDRVTVADQLQARIIAYTFSDILIHYPQAFYVMTGVR